MKFTIGPIPVMLPSTNKLYTMHWAKRSKFNNALKSIISAAVNRADVSKEIKTQIKKKVTFTRYGKRLLDDDNLAGSFKAVRDALVKAKVLVDDSPKWIVAEYQQEKSKEYAFKIEIEPIL